METTIDYEHNPNHKALLCHFMPVYVNLTIDILTLVTGLEGST